MLIKFKKPDPRAGDTVRMDSHRGQHFVDIGAADLIDERTTAGKVPAAALPPPPAPANSSKRSSAKKERSAPNKTDTAAPATTGTATDTAGSGADDSDAVSDKDSTADQANPLAGPISETNPG